VNAAGGLVVVDEGGFSEAIFHRGQSVPIFTNRDEMVEGKSRSLKVPCPCCLFCFERFTLRSDQNPIQPSIVPSAPLSLKLSSIFNTWLCLLHLFNISASLLNTLPHHSFRVAVHQHPFLFFTWSSSSPTSSHISPPSASHEHALHTPSSSHIFVKTSAKMGTPIENLAITAVDNNRVVLADSLSTNATAYAQAMPSAPEYSDDSDTESPASPNQKTDANGTTRVCRPIHRQTT
jgi:hypothetical protein